MTAAAKVGACRHALASVFAMAAGTAMCTDLGASFAESRLEKSEDRMAIFGPLMTAEARGGVDVDRADVGGLRAEADYPSGVGRKLLAQSARRGAMAAAAFQAGVVGEKCSRHSK